MTSGVGESAISPIVIIAASKSLRPPPDTTSSSGDVSSRMGNTLLGSTDDRELPGSVIAWATRGAATPRSRSARYRERAWESLERGGWQGAAAFSGEFGEKWLRHGRTGC